MAPRRKKKRVLEEAVILWAAVGFLLLFILVRSLAPSAGNRSSTVMKINFGNGQVRTFEAAPREGRTAWDMLQQANANYGVELEAAAGFWPEKIGDFKNGDSGKRWDVYVNDKLAHESPIKILLSAGDNVVYKFE